ncbi:MAG: hypothetical protein K1X55_14880 [Chitinophagales bacterium]|nr:hypothetical protein [Chitinophagales bacterium]
MEKSPAELRRLENRIDWFCKTKCNHFSPTISPAPKNKQKNEIESLEEAIRYFFDRGVQKVTLQPKYMGSYCDIYLNRDIEKTYFVSRNGHDISYIDVEDARLKCKPLHEKFTDFWENNGDWVIVQSELMPWSALGKGLIEREFAGYLYSHEHHLHFLQNSTLLSKIEQVKRSEPYLKYILDTAKMAAKEIKQHYKDHIIRQYESIRNFFVEDLEKYAQAIALFEQQLQMFGSEGELHFKPFNILKYIFLDGREEIPNNNIAAFEKVSDDKQFVVASASFEENMPNAYSFYQGLIDASLEGVMVKPEKCFIPQLPPAFKVRNNHYLQLIYGIRFNDQYDYYLERRNIKAKLECSINDWQISADMIKIPYRKIDAENYLMKLLCYKRIMQEEVESTLDTRL